MEYKKYKRLVVKIGSNVLTLESGLPDLHRVQQLVARIAELKELGMEVIVVSSGAMAAGRSIIQLTEKKMDTVSRRQILASVGQIKLMEAYLEQFSQKRHVCAQVLVTKEDFRTRQHYLNMKNCLEALIKNNVIPIINENDVISVTELMFTDNDELSGLVASMLNVDALVILSNVDGVFTGHPDDQESELITEFNERDANIEDYVVCVKSNFGRGGMLTKTKTAMKISRLGIDVFIGNGTKDNVIKDLLERRTGTCFPANDLNPSDVKKWVAQSESFSKGNVVINEGAKAALTSDRATSLLPIGINEVRGSFEKGDVIHILDESGQPVGVGMVKYDSKEARKLVGKKGSPPLVHYDYLFMNGM